MRIPTEYWYPIFLGKDLINKPISVKRFDEELVLWRDGDGKVVIMEDRCPHRGASLALGKIKDGCIQCPNHSFRFDSVGKCTLIPAHGIKGAIPRGFGAKTYPSAEKHGIIWMWWGEVPSELPPPPWPKELNNPHPFNGLRAVEIPLSFFRVMESNLDNYHYESVHSYGKFINYLTHRLFPNVLRAFRSGTVPEGYQCRVEGKRLHVKLSIRHDPNGPLSHLDGFPIESWVDFPNFAIADLPLWKSRGFFAVCPIDSESSWFVGGYYQGFCRLPWLGQIFADALTWVTFQVVELKQDIPVQVTQRPRISGMNADKLVCYADQGIAEYWKLLRREWQEKGYEMPSQTKTGENRPNRSTKASAKLDMGLTKTRKVKRPLDQATEQTQ